MTTLVINNQKYQATLEMVTLFNRYENDERMLGIIHHMGVSVGDLVLID